MVVPPNKSALSKNLKRSLLLKIISKSTPTKEDLDSVIELTANKVVDDLEAQSMTVYLVEGETISFKYVYYSPTLWADAPALETKFEEKRQQLLKLRIPLGTGMVGKVIQTGDSNIFTTESGSEELYNLSKNTDFDVTSMITVPLKEQRVIGALQVLNKEPSAKKKIFDQADLAYLQEIAEYTSALLLRILDPNYEISENDTAKYIARFTETPLITSEKEIEIDQKLLDMVGDEIVRKTGIFPYRLIEERSVAALMKNPMDFQNRESFTLKTQFMIDEVAVVPVSLFDRLCQLYFQSSAASTGPDILASGQSIHEITSLLGKEYASLEEVDETNLEALKSDNEASAPVVKLVNQVIEDAYFSGASDIHIEPQEDKLLVRYRIDGVCVEKLSLPPKVAGPIVARVKIMCDLDIAQKRLPQDGRIDFAKFTTKKINVDLRVATCPALFGEKIVMRILDKTKSALPITALGFSEENLENYRKCIRYPYGMILHCGPTGSGKSMTLFSALREVASPEINIQTAEDPVEYTIPGINQLQTHKAIGLTFAAALRSFLRMDPDVILVGEIRDQETAEIAIEAALTGHLLLSTLHTNDAPSTIARFTDMGTDPFMVSASLLVVCAQRLIRRVCKKCAVAHMPDADEKRLLETALGWSGEIVTANESGCPYCGGSGMRGRVGVHELMQNNADITRAINSNADTAKIKEIAMATGMKTLHQDAMLKVKEKTTTVMEAISNAPPDR